MSALWYAVEVLVSVDGRQLPSARWLRERRSRWGEVDRSLDGANMAALCRHLTEQAKARNGRHWWQEEQSHRVVALWPGLEGAEVCEEVCLEDLEPQAEPSSLSSEEGAPGPHPPQVQPSPGGLQLSLLAPAPASSSPALRGAAPTAEAPQPAPAPAAAPARTPEATAAPFWTACEDSILGPIRPSRRDFDTPAPAHTYAAIQASSTGRPWRVYQVRREGWDSVRAYPAPIAATARRAA